MQGFQGVWALVRDVMRLLRAKRSRPPALVRDHQPVDRPVRPESKAVPVPSEPVAEPAAEAAAKVVAEAPADASGMPDFLRGWRMPSLLDQLELPLPLPQPDLPPASEQGRFIKASYANDAGERDYKLYIPRGYRPGQPMPLLVMLHGCGQTPDDFATGTRMNELADERGFLVAYPAQTPSANGSRCWNWFHSVDQVRGHGEPSIIAGITREIIDGYSVDPRRVYVAGLSAGGAMAVILGSTYPELYAAVGVHSGMPYAAARDLPSALAAMRGSTPLTRLRTRRRRNARERPLPVIVFHGDRDTTVHHQNGSLIVNQAVQTAPRNGAAVKVEQGQVPDGHAYTRTIHRDAAGEPVAEQWLVHGAGHAWSGGSRSGSYTDARGPDASEEMMRFFATHPQSAQAH